MKLKISKIVAFLIIFSVVLYRLVRNPELTLLALVPLIIGSIFAYVGSYAYHTRIRGKRHFSLSLFLSLLLLLSTGLLAFISLWFIPTLLLFVTSDADFILAIFSGISISVICAFGSYYIYKNIYQKTKNPILWFTAVLVLAMLVIPFLMHSVIGLLLY